MEKVLMGYGVLSRDKVYHNDSFETAAWYENILVKAGKYPIYTEYDPNGYNRFDAYCRIEGEIVSDYFGTLFYGVPVGTYDNKKNAGKRSSCGMFLYSFMLADMVLDPNEGRGFFDSYELAPGFSAAKEKYISSVDGEEHELGKISYDPSKA